MGSNSARGAVLPQLHAIATSDHVFNVLKPTSQHKMISLAENSWLRLIYIRKITSSTGSWLTEPHFDTVSFCDLWLDAEPECLGIQEVLSDVWKAPNPWKWQARMVECLKKCSELVQTLCWNWHFLPLVLIHVRSFPAFLLIPCSDRSGQTGPTQASSSSFLLHAAQIKHKLQWFAVLTWILSLKWKVVGPRQGRNASVLNFHFLSKHSH